MLIIIFYSGVMLVKVCCIRNVKNSLCHGFRQPWIPIRQPGKRHFTREEKGIETIATVTVLKKERPNSLGADIFNEISEVLNFCLLCYYDCYQQNPNKCIVLENVHNIIIIRCIHVCRCIMYNIICRQGSCSTVHVIHCAGVAPARPQCF